MKRLCVCVGSSSVAFIKQKVVELDIPGIPQGQRHTVKAVHELLITEPLLFFWAEFNLT